MKPTSGTRIKIRRSTCRASSISLTVVVAILIFLGSFVYAAEPANEILAAVVKVQSNIPATARTAGSLGTERAGSGVVIDSSGLVVTIGYLILEAMRVEVKAPGGKVEAAALKVGGSLVFLLHNAGARLQGPFKLDIHFFHSIPYRFKLVVIERQAEMIDTSVFLPTARLELGVV